MDDTDPGLPAHRPARRAGVRRLAGAVAGGLVAGLALSEMLARQERQSGRPSELVALERRALARLGEEVPRPDQLPAPSEQRVVQGGHLALSALAGAAYAAATPRDSGVLGSGAAFGLAFYALMHGAVGPLLRVKPPEWRAGRGTAAAHAANHLLFGWVVAASVRAAERA